MPKLIIFGTGKIAEVAYFCFQKDSEYEVVAFTCDEAFKKTDVWHGCPIVPFEQIQKKFPPEQYHLFVAVGYQQLNWLRYVKMLESKQKGYTLANYLSSAADISSAVTLGVNCFIGPQSTLEPCVRVGDNVFCWSHVIVGHHTQLGSHLWLAAGTTIGGGAVIGDFSFVGLNSTVTQAVKIESHCFLGAQVLVNKSIAHDSVVIARPSEKLRLTAHEFFKISRFE